MKAIPVTPLEDIPEPTPLEPLSDQERAEIEKEFSHYPRKQAATIEALKIVQKYNRWVSDGKIKAIAELLEVSAEDVDAVATFYNKIYRSPVGDKVIGVCDSVSCWIMGYDKIRNHLCQVLGIKLGETTPDGKYTLIPTPCLGVCDKAPAMIVEEEIIAQLTPETIKHWLEGNTP